MRLALDAMGGDHAPAVTVAGAVEYAREHAHEVILVGNEALIEQELSKYSVRKNKITIQHAKETIGMDEPPAQAVRQKKDSSLVVAAQLVADNKADAFISAGNSGAAMAASLLCMRRIPNVSRPAIATIFPTLAGYCVLLDVGANVDCKPRHLFQFAIMGKVYLEKTFDKKNPRIGLLSIGEEENKGNELTLSTFEMLKNSPLNFIGNIEGRDIPKGLADVVVCDGFVGNIVLKFGEGVAEMVFKLVKQEMKAHPIAWAALPFLWTAMRGLRKKLDYTEHGGAPLLGVDGPCIISHGGSNAKAIKNALKAAARYAENHVNAEIAAEIEKFEALSKC
ncbi:MAG: phosphate acyltransferase [Elusimicrobia bacterium RIFOXYA2_FULL_50_26]|nr:MAG: phosphate acyltransferase [Elusimicrobia bacterium RIFOXYA2_FULL_50_26]OGS22852.1 MAG: phosphate acyltransferase [Elusimicrobia bacterium RIFOXYB2_FULL_50_12]